ncbi:hypothetical protein PQX77_011076 [Marasmius sp. AFHP31]|nr:hypothetical protein PQX77_011076 [Marasmius sp. AFHP31]
MFQSTLLCLALAVASVHSFALHDHGVGHVHRSNRRYFKDGSWSQPQDHSVNALFKRGPGNDGAQYPALGSSEWSSKYPKAGSTPPRDSLPKEWVDTLNAAIASGKIPDIPKTTIGPTGNPVYSNGLDPTSKEVCSSTYECRGPESVWDGPDGTFGISFDDGPLEPTTSLVNFLKDNKETATHFMIGGNILNNHKQFQDILDYGGDCAVHTWSHQYMTTLSNEEVLAELGWTMQIIHDSTGGKVPSIWRPPYGDSDLRVQAIAKEVFGMDTVIWNHDTGDWGMTTGINTMDSLLKNMDSWLAGPKSPGLVVLEHESTDQIVRSFMESYPRVKSNGWQTKSLAALLGDPYQNVKGNDVSPANIYGNANANVNTNSNSSTSATTTNGAAPTSVKSTGSSSTSGTSTTAASANNNNSALASTSLSSIWLAVVVALASASLVLS